LTTLRTAAFVGSAACIAVWLAVPTAWLLLRPWDDITAWGGAGLLLMSAFSVLALAKRMPRLLLWAIAPRLIVDPLALLLGTDAGFPWACAAFLADAAALLVALASMPWTDTYAQGMPNESDWVHVRSYLLDIGRPVLAGVVALIASLVVAMVSSLLDLGVTPLVIVGLAGVAALISLAALLAWNSKGL
jgi:hypothetical protein